MRLRLLTAGESHGSVLTAILDGMPAGLQLQSKIINLELARRQSGFGSGGRMKIESDHVNILSGVMAGETTGAPISLIVENVDHKNWKGKCVLPMTSPRPGHADLTGAVKYGYRDLRPALERASARETVMRVAAGAICKELLSQFGIFIGGFVRAIGEIEAQVNHSDLIHCFEISEMNDVRCPDLAAAEIMKIRIKEIIEDGDTLGGVIEIFALNVPVGLGSFMQWDSRLDGRLAQAVMSVQGIKGVEFSNAFENARTVGSQGQDEISLDETLIRRSSNRAGGIEGGISNGMPILVRAVMKPIATTLIPQKTIDLATGLETLTQYERSDYCPVPRAVPVLEAMVAFVLADVLIEKLGGDSLAEMKPRFKLLRRAQLGDLPMDNKAINWWE